MSQLGHRRQFVLFVAAILVPYVVLVALSLHMLGQDRELREKRRADERRRTLLQVREDLLARLAAIRRDETFVDLKPGSRYRSSEVALVAWVEENSLVLPWERDPVARRNHDLVSESSFSARIRECEHSEFASSQAAAAVPCYERAASSARHPVQAANARLLWARALEKAGRRLQARALFESLLAAAPDVTDEDGIPLSLYAAQGLLQAGVDPPRILAAVDAAASARPWLAPASCYVASDLVEKLAGAVPAARELRRKVATLIRLTEQAGLLQSDFPRLGLAPRNPPVWISYGEDPWLVSVARAASGRASLLAIRAKDIFEPVETRRALRLVDSREPQGEALGDPFPGLKAILEAPGDPGLQQSYDVQRRLYYFALLLVAAATAFAGYLLWRDLRRDLRMGELQAQFVSSVSHELKTPLTAIRMLAETLQMGRVRDEQAHTEYLDTIVNECERLSRLVDDVLLFSKVEQGRKVYRFQLIPLEETVQAAVRALEYPLSQKGFRLHIDIQPGLPAVKADSDALEQAVLNLLSNAMKYSGDARDIELGLGRENGSVLIRVTDHGVGIPPEEQSRIFEKFYRVPTRENQLIPGTGLGLALVAQIVKAHGGGVEVRSACGQGSTFSIRLPLEHNS